MSYVTTLSRYVELSDYNVGLLVIKNVKMHPQSPGHPIAFKVKANMKQFIDVRPAYGILVNGTQRQTVNLQIKYQGKPQDIQKAKLQIIWSSIQCKNNDDILNKKITYNDFSERLKVLTKIKQGSLVLPFQHQIPKKQQQSQDNNLSQAHTQSVSQSMNKAHTSIDTQTQREQLINNGKDQLNALSAKDINTNQVCDDGKSGVPMKKVMMLILIFFVLGILFGIKIQKMLEKPYACCSGNNQPITDQLPTTSSQQQQVIISQAENSNSNTISQSNSASKQL